MKKAAVEEVTVEEKRLVQAVLCGLVESVERNAEAVLHRSCACEAIVSLRMVTAWDAMAPDAIVSFVEEEAEPEACESDPWAPRVARRRSRKKKKIFLAKVDEEKANGSETSSRTRKVAKKETMSPPLTYTIDEEDEEVPAYLEGYSSTNRFKSVERVAEEATEEEEIESFVTTDDNFILINDDDDDCAGKKKKKKKVVPLLGYAIKESYRHLPSRMSSHHPPRECHDDSTFRACAFEQPPIGELSVVAGVRVRKGEALVDGGDLPRDPDHLSRADYESSLDTRSAPPEQKKTPPKRRKNSLPGAYVDAFRGATKKELLQSMSGNDIGDKDDLLWVAPKNPLRELRLLPHRRRRGGAPSGRMRLPRARPTRKLASLQVAPLGLSRTGLAIYEKYRDDDTLTCQTDDEKSAVSALSLPPLTTTSRVLAHHPAAP